jgi:hypothetical protein
MSDLLRLIVVVPLAYVAAVVAAGFVVYSDIVGFAVDPVYTGLIVGWSVIITGTIGAVAFVPSALAILAAELFRWRSIFFYLAVGGAIGFVSHVLSGPLKPGDNAESLAVLPAAGFVGALVYWLIAGRTAGGTAVLPPAAPTSTA